MCCCRSSSSQKNPGDRGVWSGDATRNMGFGFTETNVTINMGQQAAASLENRPVKERPIWMTESTVEGGKQDSSFSVSNSTYFLEIMELIIKII